ncbi:MAG: hypothetical protein LBC99_00705 [Spirochaetota bacterium]|jgi:hypothetical protein|nr:hypothetical protein [Spirochaetota bacterium]
MKFTKFHFWMICTALSLLLLASFIFLVLEKPTPQKEARIEAVWLLQENGERRAITLPFSERNAAGKNTYEYIVELKWRKNDNTRIHIIPDDYLQNITVNGQLMPEGKYSGPGRSDYHNGLIVDFASYLREGSNEILFRISDNGGAYGIDLKTKIPLKSSLQGLLFVLISLLVLALASLLLYRFKPGVQSSISLITLAYLFLPFLIFLAGWVKPVISIPMFAVLLYILFRMQKSFPDFWMPELHKRNLLKLIAIFCLILFWVYISGIGASVAQNTDHLHRNAVFQSLVEEDWPVIYSSNEHYHKPVALVYYFGFWLPSAVVGKLFGISAGSIAQMLWAAMGIFIFYCFFLAIFVRKIVFWPLIIFIFFSGLDILGIRLLGRDTSTVGSTEHLEWWASPFQYSSITTQIFWVFNQALPAWLAAVLLLLQKDNRFIVVIIALVLISSTLPFVGLLIIACAIIIKNICSENAPRITAAAFKDSMYRLFSFENVVGGGLIGLSSYFFLKTNIAGSKIALLSSHSTKGILFLWMLFFMVEAGLYILAIYKYQKGSYLYYVSAVSLAIIPFIRVGYFSDFCMRASIPVLVLLFFMVIDTLLKAFAAKDKMIIAVLALLLIIGSSTPYREIVRTTSTTVQNFHARRQIEAGSVDLSSGAQDNFCGYVKNTFFFDTIGRVPGKK